MTYAEQYEKAVAEKLAQKIDISIHRWEHEGDKLVGRVLAVDRKESDTFDSEYSQYLLETDGGYVATIFGASVDMLFKTENPVGNVYAFEYQGKRKLDGGRQMNVFTVYKIPTTKGGVK